MSPAGAKGQRRPAAARRRPRRRRAEQPEESPEAARQELRKRREPAEDEPRAMKVRHARRRRRRERLRGAAGGFADPRRQLAITGTITVIGLAMVGLRESFVGSLITLLGCLAFMWAIHKYGRLGPEGG